MGNDAVIIILNGSLAFAIVSAALKHLLLISTPIIATGTRIMTSDIMVLRNEVTAVCCPAASDQPQDERHHPNGSDCGEVCHAHTVILPYFLYKYYANCEKMYLFPFLLALIPNGYSHIGHMF